MRRAIELLLAVLFLLPATTAAAQRAVPAAPVYKIYITPRIQAPTEALRIEVYDAILWLRADLEKSPFIAFVTDPQAADFALEELELKRGACKTMRLRAKFRRQKAAAQDVFTECPYCDAGSHVNDLFNRTLLHATQGVYQALRIRGCKAATLVMITTTLEPPKGIEPTTAFPYTIAEWAGVAGRDWEPVGPLLRMLQYTPAPQHPGATFEITSTSPIVASFRTADCREPPPHTIAAMPRLLVQQGGDINCNAPAATR